jgi:hypothetical protein
MRTLSVVEMTAIEGGQCSALMKTGVVACTLAAVTGGFGALVFGPTCLGAAIGYAAAC